jgi:hypothetical protein
MTFRSLDGFARNFDPRFIEWILCIYWVRKVVFLDRILGSSVDC